MSGTPLFVISLPRAGSTLLQRMLAVSDSIASASEPWIMLSFFGLRDPSAGREVYAHHTSARAITDFISSIPDGDKVLDEAIHQFGSTIFHAAAEGASYFLDKTPRYFLIIDQLRRSFPEAKFIYLTRNPLSSISSMCRTFYKGRFMMHDSMIDWIEGNQRIARALKDIKSNEICIAYEDLVKNPEQELQHICRWLDIAFDDSMVSNFDSSQLAGRMGDPTGVIKYQRVSGQSLESWKSFFASDYRVSKAKSLLDKLSEDDLLALGYPKSELISELEAIPTTLGFDLKARVQGILDYLMKVCDYRYIKSRFEATKSNSLYDFGRFRY